MCLNNRTLYAQAAWVVARGTRAVPPSVPNPVGPGKSRRAWRICIRLAGRPWTTRRGFRTTRRVDHGGLAHHEVTGRRESAGRGGVERRGAASILEGVRRRLASRLYSRETFTSARIASRSKHHRWSCSRLRQRDNATYCHDRTTHVMDRAEVLYVAGVRENICSPLGHPQRIRS